MLRMFHFVNLSLMRHSSDPLREEHARERDPERDRGRAGDERPDARSAMLFR